MSKLKVIFFLALFLSFSFYSLNAANESSSQLSKENSKISKSQIETLKKTAKEEAGKAIKLEALLADRVTSAIKERDIKWKVCLDNYTAVLKGIAVSALNISAKIPDLLDIGKTDDAQSQMILLKGLVESAEKTFLESELCERQLTDVSAENTVTKEHNKEITGEVFKDSVSDAMGVGFSDEFVTETDKSVVPGSDFADAGGVDYNDINSETSRSPGEKSDSEKEAADKIDKPEVVDASPTK
ncbi:MAG: hypothetical protein ACOX2F_03970 [bacterium]